MLNDSRNDVVHSGYTYSTDSAAEALPRQYTVDTPYMVGPVHYYTGKIAGELVLFDTGPPTDGGRRHLLQHVDLAKIRHVIITHCHIDHFGQAAWIEQESDAAIYLPRRDTMKAGNQEKRIAKVTEFFKEMGFKQRFLKLFHEFFVRSVSPVLPDRFLVAETDLPARLGIEVLSCPGHSQSDLVYRSGGWAITGDTLLRGIFQSPLLDVDFETGERFRNYRAYCSSIVKLAGLRNVKVLPGHRQKIDSVDATILFYIKKILRRVRQLQPYIGELSVADIIARLFPTMTDPFHIYLKSSEIVFMREFLEQPDLLGSSLRQIGLFDQVAEDFYHIAHR